MAQVKAGSYKHQKSPFNTLISDLFWKYECMYKYNFIFECMTKAYTITSLYMCFQ